MSNRLSTIVALVLSLFVAEAIGAFNSLDNWMQGKRFIASRSPVESNIAIVAIDSKSIAGIGQWPWPRTVHAKILDKLVAARAAQVAFDVDFSSASTAPADEAFRQSLKAAGGSTVLASFKQLDGGELVDTVPLAMFSENAWLASVSVRADGDGIVRRVPISESLVGQTTPSLAAYLAQASSNGPSDVNIDFAISSSSFQVVSAIDLIEGRVPPEALSGRDVIVGATAVELRDLYLTPTRDIIPGSVLQALAAETIKRDRSVAAPGLLPRTAGLCIIGLLGLLASRRSWVTQVAVYAAAAASIELAALMLQSTQHVSLPTSGWLAALAALAATATLAELGVRGLRIGAIETRLGATKALLQEVIADSPAGVIVVDESNIIRVANLAARQILDAGKSEWLGLPAAEALPPGLAQLLETASQPGEIQLLRQQQGQITLQLSQSVKVFEYSLTASTVASDEDGRPPGQARCLTFQDVTERHEQVQRLSYLALHDTKTGSRNRHSFVQDLEQLAAQATPVTVIQIGIDRFRTINDQFGHEVGDQLLNELARRARMLLRDARPLYRIAGDEFACIVSHAAGSTDESSLVHAFLDLAGLAQLGPYEVRFSISVGVASAAEKHWNADEIIRRSGLALAFAKTDGGRRICTFDAQLDAAAAKRKALESALVGALDRQEFHLLYQPQFDLASGRCIGVEALLRWTSPVLGAVPPNEFIPVAEQLGMIDDIGAWVLQRACREIAHICSDIAVAVNVSTRQFLRGNLTDLVAASLELSGLAPQRLEIEITESVLAENTPRTIETLQGLRAAGVAVALDDFGTGYSSLSYLLNLPLDKIKIDKSFVTGLPHDTKAVAVLKSIIGVAKALGLKAIAEGIETVDQKNTLSKAGCHHGQGYLFAKPMGPEALAVYLRILGLEVTDPAQVGDSANMQRMMSA